MQGIYDLITSFLPAIQPKKSLNQTMKHTKRTGFVGQAFLLILLLWTPLLSAGQGSGAIAGRIVDKGNQPIIGANVTVKGSTTGSATDLNGNYSIGSLKPGNITLDVSYLGYKTQSISVTVRSSGVTTANFTLTEDAQLLQEAVIVGYGTTQTRDLTGAVTAIPSKVFQQGNFSTPEQLVIGKTPGVRITNNSGLPGGGSVIRIRGGSSLNASNDPLIVIDGVPVDNGGIAGAANPLALINPEDIETFTVLKDASAAAIYGSRAANGVILITTKKGAASDRVRVELTTNSSAKQITRTVNVLDTAQLKQLIREKGTNAQKNLLNQPSANNATDWQSEIYQLALINDINLTLSGGIKDLPYRLGFERYDEQGNLRTGKLERTGLNLNISPKIGPYLKVDLNTKYFNLQNRFADGGAIGSAVVFDPSRPVKRDTSAYNGYFEWANNAQPLQLATKNPMGLLNQKEDRSSVNRFIGNVLLDFETPGLSDLHFFLNLGGDYSSSTGSVVIDSNAAAVWTRRGVNNQYAMTKTNRLIDTYFNYKKELKSLLSSMDVTGGYSFQHWSTESPTFPDINQRGDTIQKPNPFDFFTENALMSFYGRLNYTFLDHYLLTATLRADGSSRFAPENRWGLFPSVAFAWRMSDLGFFSQIPSISNMKLRIGWGVTGQQDGIGDYSYLANYSQSTPSAYYQFGNNFLPMLRPQGFDANLKWEETSSTNIGLDYGFFKNRINGSIDYYKKKTYDLLAVIPTIAGTNFSDLILTNVGDLENEGVEWNINAVAIDNKEMNLEFGFNATWNRTTITKLTRVPDSTNQGILVGGISGGVGNTIQIHSVGFTPNTFYMYRQIYGSDGRPLEGKYWAPNGKDTISSPTAKDLRKDKNHIPTVYLGFFSNLRYKKWNAGFSMRAELGRYMYNNVNSNNGTLAGTGGSLGFINNITTDYLNTGFRLNQLKSDYYLERADFLRMDNLFVGYDFGKPFGNDLAFRLSASIQNVFVITNYSGVDPEIFGGIDNNIYPRARVYSVNLNFKF
jgi:iron complex outermembrane receptor protein